MTKAERIKRIADILGTIGGTSLSSKCREYYSIYKDKDGIWVSSFVGENGYEVAEINILPSKVITMIYNDLAVDFKELN